jgi:hypothetical protein
MLILKIIEFFGTRSLMCKMKLCAFVGRAELKWCAFTQ